MRILYNLIIYLTIPFVLARLLLKIRKNPEYKNRIGERFGIYRDKPLKNSIWIHAVSLGESIAATPLIKKLQRLYPNTKIVVTTTTPTGSAKIQQTFANSVYHVYFPYDYPLVVKKFLKHVNPKIAIIMETELWPNVLHYCHKLNIPTLLANARLSPHSYKRYKIIGSIVTEMLNNISIIAAQSDLDAERFIDLGANKNKTINSGNIKFNINIEDNLEMQAKNLRGKIGNNRSIWIAASTHAKEEEQILAAHKIIKDKIKNSLLILVPRHPERFEQVTRLCQQQFNTITYSSKQNCTDDIDIIVGDVMGKMMLLYAVSDIAFVGGSLVPIGGHNLLEPAALKKPIITGNYLFNFVEISELLKQAGGVIIVNNPQELANNIITLFEDQMVQNALAASAYKVVVQNKGALDKLLALTSKLMKN